MNFRGRIEANQGPSNGPITGHIAVEFDGRTTMIEFTLDKPESDDVSVAFRRNGELFADFQLGMEESELTANQRAILHTTSSDRYIRANMEPKSSIERIWEDRTT